MLLRKHTAGRKLAIRGGFTLLELLVSMSILAVLLVLLLAMVNGATKLWKANENRVDSYREARAAINLIASDLTAIYPSSHLSYFYTQDDKKPDTPVKVSKMDGSLFFLTALPIEAQGTGKSTQYNNSDLCTVGYFLGYDKTSLTGKGADSYNLYRYFRGSDETFAAIQTGDDILSGVTPDTAVTSKNCEVLAKNVTSFTVAAYEIPPATDKNPSPTPAPFNKSADTPLPDMLEITVTAINNDVAKRFAGKQGDWENSRSITRLQNDRKFTTRIYLAGAAQVKATPSPSPTP